MGFFTRLLKPKIIFQRASQIILDEGLCSLWFRVWGQICYRRIGLFIRDLDGSPIETVPAKWQLELGQLKAKDTADYMILHDDIGISELQHRFANGQMCFTARFQNNLVYTCWIARNYAWIEYLSRRIPLAIDEAYFYESFTAPNYRGGNVATICQKYIQEILKRDGLHCLIAVVLAENKSAIRAIRKAGYRRVGTLRTIWLYVWRCSWGQVPI